MTMNGGHHHHRISNGYLQHLTFHCKPVQTKSWLSFLKPTPLKFLLLLLLAIFTSSILFHLSIPQYPSSHPCSSGSNQFLSGETVAKGREDHAVVKGENVEDAREEEEGGDGVLWKQPDGLGYRPCLNFSEEYQKTSEQMSVGRRGREKVAGRRRFLMVVVAGGLNQQRNQIVDAVVIARILEAELVVPILQVNAVWSDESEFVDIFDEMRFKETLMDDVHVVSSLPSTHLRMRPVADSIRDFDVGEQWIRSRFQAKIRKHDVLLLRGLDSRVSKDLSPDLQKLRCKVAFHALQFRAAIQEVGNKLAARMAKRGPYLALHLRLEKDVWVRTGCLPGLGDQADRAIGMERAAHPRLLTARTKLGAHDRYIAGLCPLKPIDIARLLKAFGATSKTRIYLAGGKPFGGEEALWPLRSDFPNVHNKQSLAKAGEVEQFKDQPSVLAALDYIVCLKSQVFMANHGGNMARAMQGHRAYLGHRKHITPNKRSLIQFMSNRTDTMDESEVNGAIRMMHADLMGDPMFRTDKKGRDVIAYPVPECMCRTRKEA